MSTPLASMSSSSVWWTLGITACSSWLSSLYVPCRSFPLMLTVLILPAFTSFINCVYESWASGRDLVVCTTVQNSTTTTMITTQNMAVLKFELFMPSPYTWGHNAQFVGRYSRSYGFESSYAVSATRSTERVSGPDDGLIISDNRPVPAFPQGYPGFLEEKLDLFRFGLPDSSVLVTWSPVTQLKAGRVPALAATLPVQFTHHCSTRQWGCLFLQHLQCNTGAGTGKFHRSRVLEGEGEVAIRVHGAGRRETDQVKGAADVQAGRLKAVVPDVGSRHFEHAL